MKYKVITGIMLTLLLANMPILVFNIQPIKEDVEDRGISFGHASVISCIHARMYEISAKPVEDLVRKEANMKTNIR